MKVSGGVITSPQHFSARFTYTLHIPYSLHIQLFSCRSIFSFVMAVTISNYVYKPEGQYVQTNQIGATVKLFQNF